MKVLKALRKQLHITQDQLAESLGVSRSTISMWETGASDPDPDTINRIADYFDVSTDYLLGRTDDPSPRPRALPEEYEVYDPEAQAIMREMYERPELRALFLTSRKVKPESIRAVDALLKKMAGEDDEGAT